MPRGRHPDLDGSPGVGSRQRGLRGVLRLKRERINRRSWPTRREAQTAIFEWIEGWYNPRRLHSTLRYLSPNNYEQ
jgi:transposase InsO family protein